MLLKFLRPSKVIAKAFVNPTKDQWLDDLIAVNGETTTRGGKMFMSIFFRSPTIPGLIHAAEQWVNVLEQGTDKVWGGEPEVTVAVAPVTPNEQNKPIAEFVFNAQFSWSKKLVLRKKLASPKFLPGNT